MMTTPSSTSATSAIVRKRVRPRITGTGTQIEKPGKVTWDDSLSLDATTITLYIIDPRPLRDGPLENLLGGGREGRKGKLNEKIHERQLTLKKIHAMG